MAGCETFEAVIQNQLNTIDQLELATLYIKNKSSVKNILMEAQEHTKALSESVEDAKHDLETLQEGVVELELLSKQMEILNGKLEYMEKNIPAQLLNTALESRVNGHAPPGVQKPNNSHATHTAASNGLYDVVDPTEYSPQHQDCRKILFKDSREPSYVIERVSEAEFSKVPKYMVGRQTLANLNDLVTTINGITKAKYSLLALGKAGARKKGELELYLQLFKEQSDECSGKTKKYFFTPDDYQREIKSKLDKTKLNLLTVLRHCNRLQEQRNGKNIKYIIKSR